MSSSIFSRSSATHRRPHQASNSVSPPGPPIPQLDASPNPRPITQLLALVAVVFLGFLQFLPATHFRDPFDPLRKWVPFDSGSPSSSFSRPVASEDGKIYIVSWMDCLDLRVLAVLANSTLSNSRSPDKVHFRFFIPKGHDDKESYFKLKVLFPHLDLEIFGQEDVKEKIRTANSDAVYAGGLTFEEIAPFVIPIIYRSWSKIIYISPNVIVKGRIEELFGTNLTSYAIGVIEDCSERLDNYVNSEVLAAIQRTDLKPWISVTPYIMKACMLDSSILLIDPRKLDKDLGKAILWWSYVLNWSKRSSSKNPAIALALHGRYSKLSDSWLLGQSKRGIDKERMILLYDGPRKLCSEFGDVPSQSVPGNLWKQYLPPMADKILDR